MYGKIKLYQYLISILIYLNCLLYVEWTCIFTTGIICIVTVRNAVVKQSISAVCANNLNFYLVYRCRLVINLRI